MMRPPSLVSMSNSNFAPSPGDKDSRMVRAGIRNVFGAVAARSSAEINNHPFSSIVEEIGGLFIYLFPVQARGEHSAGQKRGPKPWRGRVGPKDCYGRGHDGLPPAFSLTPTTGSSKRGEQSAPRAV